jgi:hypothetical protein
MSSFPFNPLVKRCPRGHPTDSDTCGYCDAENKVRDAQDDKLLEQLKRLAETGKIRGVSFE